MPLYFFDINDGTTLFRDGVGSDFAGDQEAGDEGSRAMAEMAKDFIPGGEPQKNMTMWIRSDDGAARLQLSMSFAIRTLNEQQPQLS